MPKSSLNSEPESFFSSPQRSAQPAPESIEQTDETTDTAIVYCEGAFGSDKGSYTTRLLQHSEKYRVLSVIDSAHAGEDTGTALGEEPHGIPIRKDLKEALDLADRVPGAFILGSERTETPSESKAILAAIDKKLTIVNAWQPFLSDDPKIAAAAAKKGVRLIDLQKPKEGTEFQSFSGRIKEINCPILAVIGTDTDLGTRDTAIAITRSLNNRGVRTTMISTGQEGLTQGARYGIVLETIPEEYREGELEAVVLRAFEAESPELIVIEGQGALGHQENNLAEVILRGGYPHGAVLQHAPKRKQRASNPELPIQPLSKAVIQLENYTEGRPNLRVFGVTLNPENMATAQLDAAIVWLESNLERPVIAPLSQPTARLVKIVADAFPTIKRRIEGSIAKETEETEED